MTGAVEFVCIAVVLVCWGASLLGVLAVRR